MVSFLSKLFSLLFVTTVWATAYTINPIKVDQFGYFPTAPKVAVISNPITGFNAGENFTPTSSYEVRKVTDESVVYTGSITSWKAGSTDARSGDQVWYFDFSSLEAEGEYYIYDAVNNERSDTFAISTTVYDALLKASVRMLYYQRSNFDKTAPYTQEPWIDGKAFSQDETATYILDKTNTATQKNVSGGWFDAGDYNKYINYSEEVVHDLLLAYTLHPAIWGDDYNIPESGNGIPDILDELRYELEWVLKMQVNADDVDGSNPAFTQTDRGAFLHKVSALNFGQGNESPPSSNRDPRYYAPPTVSATISAVGMLAHAATVYKEIDSTFAAQLQTAAIEGWNYLEGKAYSSYNNSGFGTAGAEDSVTQQKANKIAAAIYLYQLTGEASYRTYFESNAADGKLIDQTNFSSLNEAYFYSDGNRLTAHDAQLVYSQLSGIDSTFAEAIQTNYTFAQTNPWVDFAPVKAFDEQESSYLAFVDAYPWGSNQSIGSSGNMVLNMAFYQLDSTHTAKYAALASHYLHYLHGINPHNLVYLSSMAGLGAEHSVDVIHHAWFVDGISPAPAYLVGGASEDYSGDAMIYGASVADQPALKSYASDYDAYELSEPQLMYQSAYIRLLSGIMAYYTKDTNQNGDQTQMLNAGWNLVGINSELTLPDILSQLGSDNVEVIQGADTTYQKRFVEQGNTFLNDFTRFEKGKGYWIKLNQSAALNYTETTYPNEERITLAAGWNLINPIASLTLETIQTQLGTENLEMIVGDNRIYNRIADAGANTFTQFEEPYGYLIKLNESADLVFNSVPVPETFTPDNYLVNNGAEEGTTGWTTFGGGAALQASTQQAHSGSYSFLSSSRTQYYHGPSTNIKPLVVEGKLVSGERYTASVWVYHTQSTTETIHLYLKQKDSSGTQYIKLEDEAVPPNEWVKITKHFVLNADVATLSELTLYVVTSSGKTFDFYTDDFFLGELENYTPPTSSAVSSFVRAKAKELVVGSSEESIVLKGINVSIPNDATDTTEDVWDTKTIDGKSFQDIKAMGFNSVRLQMYYKTFEDDNNVGFFKEDGWHWLDRVIGFAKEAGLYILLDMHAPQGGYQSDKAKGFSAFWDNAVGLPNTANQDRLLALWRAIAERYQHEPTVLGYDLINEPRPNNAEEWFSYAEQLIGAIRAVDSHHLIVVEAPLISGYTMRTVADTNVLYDSHYYTTWEYTTQYSAQYGNAGDEWGVYNPTDPIYLDWNWNVVWRPESGGTAPANSQPFDKSFLESVFYEDILDFADTNSVPVDIGEYGIVYEAYDEAVGAIEWMQDVHRIFEGENKYGMRLNSFYFNYQGTTFGIYYNWSGFQPNRAFMNQQLRDFFMGE